MPDGMERRKFLKVLGAAGAGAGMLGCSPQGAEKLLPYVVPAEEIVPGLATWYRTTCRECPAGCGMEIRTREGRAVKAEGNSLSPISHGRLCPRGQGSLQGLYNPDRVPQALVRSGDELQPVSWSDAEDRLVQALAQAQGQAVFLTSTFTGALDRLVDEWCAAMGVERIRFDSFAWEPLRAANRMLFGIDAVPVHDFANAEVVVSFGADFLETWISNVDYAHGYSEGHAYNEGRRGVHVSVTPHQSLTDMNADVWLAARPGTEHLVALAIARSIVDQGLGDGGAAGAFLQQVDVAAAAQAADVPVDQITSVARAFANGGRSLAVGPGVSNAGSNATSVALAVALLNQVAGNIGQTVNFAQQELFANTGTYQDLIGLFDRIRAGQVGALLVHGPNPLHGVPLPADAAELLDNVPFLASFSSYEDETTARADLLLPDHHFLESWGDYVPRTGVFSLVQPVMLPVFATKQTGDVLLSTARRAGAPLPSAATTYHEYLLAHWQEVVYPASGSTQPFDTWWREALVNGVVTSPAAEPVAVATNAGALQQISLDPAQITGEGDYTLVVYPSIRFYDGRLANRPWLQELPDPVSKISWTSWVEVNPRTADALGLDTGSIVEVSTANGTAELPVWRHPGTRPEVIAIQLGQGHQALGRYASDRGVNAAAFLSPEVEAASGGVVWLQARAALRPTGRWERLPQGQVQETQEDRGIAQAVPLSEASVAEEHPYETEYYQLQAAGGLLPAVVDGAPSDFPPLGADYGEYGGEHPRWGMAIDLDRCIGCSACMVACSAENNIGIVGPEQVARGRNLTWMRIERYFEGEGDEFETRFVPMLCQHCTNAPCEPVCPVYAAYHTPEGLNAQVYNRCVGTRYCANNCPYKVRYFNWFTYEWPEPLNWQLNPDVTVRETGVMEKCTFCVQRIRGAQHDARREGRAVADGEIVPACQQTCPTNAITFGNVKDPNAQATQRSLSPRGYRVLEETNTQSAIVYLKKVLTDVTEV